MEIYYYSGEDRLGPVNPAQLRSLAAAGIVTPETVIEAGGKKIPAAKVKGLEFPPAAPPPVTPAAETRPAEPVSEPPADVPFVAPYGGVQYLKPEEKTAEPELTASERTQTDLRLAAQFVESSCVALKAVGWFFYVGAAVSLFGGIIAAANTESFAFIGVGLAGLAAGWASAQIPFALEKMGRFLIARYNADRYGGQWPRKRAKDARKWFLFAPFTPASRCETFQKINPKRLILRYFGGFFAVFPQISRSDR